MIAILSVYCKIGYIFSQLVLCMYVSRFDGHDLWYKSTEYTCTSILNSIIIKFNISCLYSYKIAN